MTEILLSTRTNQRARKAIEAFRLAGRCMGSFSSRVIGKMHRFHWIEAVERRVGSMMLVSILSFATTVCSWSQEAGPAQRTVSTAGSPFAEVDESLLQTANAALALARQTNAVPAIPSLPEASIAKTATDNDPHFQFGQGASIANASLRLSLLRPIIDPILRKVGVPTELAAVVFVESSGDTLALSPKGARGLWQLMPDTARRYGLIVNATEDERIDVEKSTDAAARYLRDLYAQFGSWPLALAAYNTGEQNLQLAIERGRSMNFTVLTSLGLLPLETRNYVPAVFAAEERFTEPTSATRRLIPWGREGWTVFAIAKKGK